jgi:hypothetical protein
MGAQGHATRLVADELAALAAQVDDPETASRPR